MNWFSAPILALLLALSPAWASTRLPGCDFYILNSLVTEVESGDEIAYPVVFSDDRHFWHGNQAQGLVKYAVSETGELEEVSRIPGSFPNPNGRLNYSTALSHDGKMIAFSGRMRDRTSEVNDYSSFFEVFDTATGESLWIRPLQDQPGSRVIHLTFAPQNDGLLFVQENAVMGLVSVENRNVIFARDTADSLSTTEVPADLHSDPVFQAASNDLYGKFGCETEAIFSPEGRRVISSCRHGIVKVWESRLGALQKTFNFRPHEKIEAEHRAAREWGLTLSPDRSHIIHKYTLNTMDGDFRASNAPHLTSIHSINLHDLSDQLIFREEFWREPQESHVGIVTPAHSFTAGRLAVVSRSRELIVTDYRTGAVIEKLPIIVPNDKHRLVQIFVREEAGELKVTGLTDWGALWFWKNLRVEARPRIGANFTPDRGRIEKMTRSPDKRYLFLHLTKEGMDNIQMLDTRKIFELSQRP